MSDVAHAQEPEVVEPEAVEPTPAPEPVVEPAEPAKEPAAREPAEKDSVKETYWPDDWRVRMAEHASAGDKKAFDKELRRLERFTEPSAVYGMARELEQRISNQGLLKIPGEDAPEEEVNEFLQALGVPESPDKYFENLELSEGIQLGEQDIPMLHSFAEALHGAGAPQPVVNAAIDWYYKVQEEGAAAQDDTDHEFRREAETALKEEFGPGYKRLTNAIGTLFSTAPGGLDAENPEALMNRLLGGRMADGTRIGDDPDMYRFLAAVAKDRGLGITDVELGDESGKSIDSELKEIDEYRRANRQAYFKDDAMQARERELLEAKERLQARNRG